MTDVAVRAGVLACLLYSIELSDCALTDPDVCDEDCNEDSGVTEGPGKAGPISRLDTWSTI